MVPTRRHHLDRGIVHAPHHVGRGGHLTAKDQQPRRQSTHREPSLPHVEYLFLWFGDEPVTDSTDRLDQASLASALELLPDPRNVHLERVGFRAGGHRPHRFRQLLVRDELAAAPHQGGQDPELDAGQAQLPSASRRKSLAEVKGDVADHEARTALAAVPPDHRLHARHQLLEREGLGDVVVGSQLQAGDPIAHRRSCTDAYERGVGLGSERLEQLGPIVVRKHQVEEHHVGVPLADELDSAARGVDGADGVALLAQAGRNRPGEPAIVLDERDLPTNRHSRCGAFSHGSGDPALLAARNLAAQIARC